MKVTVIGGSGFVGRNLVNNLERNGYDTYSINRTSTGREREILMDLNLADEFYIKRQLSNSECVILLAAYPNFGASFDFQTYQTNCLVNLKIINALRNTKTHLIFASNALISGIKLNLIDRNSPDTPEIPYNISKFISEQYIKNNLEYQSILRIGGIYGYDGPKHLFLNKAIISAINNKIIPSMTDNGSGKRNYIYVDDLSSWILNIINTKTYGTSLIAGKEILSMNSILSTLHDVFIGEGRFKYDIDAPDGLDQVIETDYPTLTFHSYKDAFLNIKNSL